MSKQLRQRRLENGALTVGQAQLAFKVDDDGDDHELKGLYVIKDSNRLIEEFMLKANISVAERIAEVFPAQALLRCHPVPKERGFEKFQEQMKKFGIEINRINAIEIQRALAQLSKKAKHIESVSSFLLIDLKKNLFIGM